MHFTVLSFCELGPMLLNCGHYLRTDDFFQALWSNIFLSSIIEVVPRTTTQSVNEYLENIAALHIRQHLGIVFKTMNI